MENEIDFGARLRLRVSFEMLFSGVLLSFVVELKDRRRAIAIVVMTLMRGLQQGAWNSLLLACTAPIIASTSSN